jgi:hypothetical protein
MPRESYLEDLLLCDPSFTGHSLVQVGFLFYVRQSLFIKIFQFIYSSLTKAKTWKGLPEEQSDSLCTICCLAEDRQGELQSGAERF